MDSGGADETRLLRERVEALESLIERLEREFVDGGLTLSAKTVSGGSYPAGGVVGTTYYVQAQDVTGAMMEGGAGTLTARGNKFLAVLLTAGTPLVNSEVIIHEVGGAFVFLF